MKKRGQFFLIAALIIAVIIFGLRASYVSLSSPAEDTRIYDLSEEINFESSQVIDSGVVEGQGEEQIYNNLKELTKSYAELNPNSDLAVYYGNETEIKAVSYETSSSGEVGFNLGGTQTGFTTIKNRNVREAKYSSTDFLCSLSGNCQKKVRLILKGNNDKDYNYDFKLKKGQNFFIVIKKEKGDERIVVSNE